MDLNNTLEDLQFSIKNTIKYLEKEAEHILNNKTNVFWDVYKISNKSKQSLEQLLDQIEDMKE